MKDGVVSRDCFDLHYRIAGTTGDFLVVLSGGPGADVGHMQPVADELRATHRVVLLEQRGTGRSSLARYDGETIALKAYIDDLDSLRRHLRVERLILVGNSWGMALALAYGVEHPTHVRAIVSIGSAPLTMDDARAMQDNVSSRLTVQEREIVSSLQAKIMTDPQRAFRELTNIQRPVFLFHRNRAESSLIDDRPTGVNLAVLRASTPMFEAVTKRVLPHLTRIPSPVLLIHGRQDPVPEVGVVEAARLLPNATLKLLHQCGHEPWLDQPDEVFHLVRRFLEGIEVE